MIKQMTTHRPGLIFTAAGIAAVLAGPALAQGLNPVVDLGYSVGLFHEDEDGAEADTYIGLTFFGRAATETRSQRFSFAVDTAAEIHEGASDFTNTNAALDYAIFNRSSELSVGLDYSEADIDGEIDGIDFDADDLITDDGVLETHAARIRLVTGRDRLFGTNTTIGFSQDDYVGTTDPDLVSSTTLDAATELRFTLGRTAELRLSGLWRETGEDDALNTDSTFVRVALAGDVLVDPAWRASFAIGVSELETEEDGGGGRVTTIEEGADLRLGATRFMPNGTLAFSAGISVIEDETISDLSVTRDMELPGGADFSGSAGLVLFDNGDVRPFFSLSYSNEILPGQQLSVSLSQEGDSDDGETSLRTLLDAAYTQALTPVSSISVTGQLAGVNVIDGASADTLAATFGLAYSHDLTPEWALVARADHRRVYEDDVQTDRISAVSITLERSFSFRP